MYVTSACWIDTLELRRVILMTHRQVARRSIDVEYQIFEIGHQSNHKKIYIPMITKKAQTVGEKLLNEG